MRIRTLFASSILLALTALTATAQSHSDREGMRGIVGVEVVIEMLPPPANSIGLM